MMDLKKYNEVAKNIILFSKETGIEINPKSVEVIVHHTGDSNRNASVHFFVDEDSVTEVEPVISFHEVTAWKPRDTITPIEGAVASVNAIKHEVRREKISMWDDINLDDFRLEPISQISAYSAIGMSALNLASFYEPTEPLSMMERKKRYNDGIKKFLNKGKKW